MTNAVIMCYVCLVVGACIGFAVCAVLSANESDSSGDVLPELRGRWIPVNERLPQSDGMYIVTACDEGCPQDEGIWHSTVVVYAEYYKGSWTWYEGTHEWSLEDIVTHWMPLPEPPQEVSET